MGTSSASIYDKTTVILHWTTAILVVVLWITGQTADSFPKGPFREAYWSFHVSLGFVFAVVLVWRLVWRGFHGVRLPPAGSGVLQTISDAAHYVLYALLASVVVLGVVNAFVRGYSLFDIVVLPQLGDKAWRKPVTHWHELAANLLLILALGHAAAALAHHYVLKDNILRRMLPGVGPR